MTAPTGPEQGRLEATCLCGDSFVSCDVPDDDERAELDDWHAAHERCTAELDVPVPPGASADGWALTDESGRRMRALTWGTPFDTDAVGLEIGGLQSEAGPWSRTILMYASEGQELTASDARALSVKLVEAADALDRLDGINTG